MSPVRALVTGGSGGIGAAICRRLAADGRHVIVHAHHGLEAARAIAADIAARGGSAEALAFDVTHADAARAALEALLEAGPVQIVVNNAGIHDDAPLPGMSESQWRRVIDVSLHGFFHVTQPLVLPMLRTRWGRIVNMASVSAMTGNRGQVNYAAAKGALISATRALALELGKRGVTVNAVAPGLIDTPMSADFPEERVRALVPLQRTGTAEEVAGLVAFLASDRASYITGQTVPINGGMI
ncbi:MAG TPA: 3-oxoacyl-ACP reductase FabG [Burkholderiales bacterium]|nr:3-oxoacyl-ACP reductase FabG [Burkholderiales bacterium]